MNYKAFYRTYRPVTFSQVVGQDHIVKTLINILKMNKISHGYLFSGPRGTGKTSIARIFANALNCIHSESPEQICQYCLNNSSKSLDIIEIDAASNNGVGDIRTIKEQINFTPTNSTYKIYIIDEVHMLSKSAFNSLLMTLEEPPKHAIFILATTDPDKIPDTILSRVQKYNFKRISKSYLKDQLNFIFNKEQIKCEPEALNLIASLANGSLRDALSIADQINAYSNSNITKENLIEIFGLTSVDFQIRLINLIAQKNVGESLSIFNEMVNKGIDITKLIFSLINLLKDFLVYKKTSNANLIESTDEEHILQIQIKSEYIYKVLDILVPLVNEIKYSEIPHQLFQLAIIKLCSINENLTDIIPNKKISSIDKTQPIKIQKETSFKDLGKTNDIDDNVFIQKEINSNTQPIESSLFNSQNINNSINNNENINKTQTKTILNDINTTELQKRLEQFNDTDLFSSISFGDTNENKIKQNNTNQTTKTKEMDTDEIIQSTTTILNVSNEESSIVNEVNESILDSTQEINIKNNQKQIYDTNEININKNQINDLNKILFESKINSNEITKEFNFNDSNVNKNVDKQIETSEYKLTQPNIINLFLCSQKNTFDHFKQKLIEAANVNDEENSIFTTLFKEIRFICSGQNFILVSSKENWVINDLNDHIKGDKFKMFISKYLGRDIHFFAITKKDYEDSKNLYMELKKTNNVPKKHIIPTKQINSNYNIDNNLINDEHYKTDQKAKALFGSLFKKK